MTIEAATSKTEIKQTSD